MTRLAVNGRVTRRTGTWSDEGHQKDTGFGVRKSDSRSEEDQMLLALRKLESSSMKDAGQRKNDGRCQAVRDTFLFATGQTIILHNITFT
jgi:hypothetical protein